MDTGTANSKLIAIAVSTGVLVSHALNTASGTQTTIQRTIVATARKRRDLMGDVLWLW